MTAPNELHLFDYNEAEWAEIEVSARPVRRSGLSIKDRDVLRAAAREYLSAPPRAAMRALRDEWQKVQSLSEKLEPKLAACLQQTDFNSIGGDKKMNEFRMVAARGALHYLRFLTAVANFLAHNVAKGGDPRLTYQSKVLESWVRLGGKLKLSRHPRTQKVQGPLAKYFFAVTRPVMGTSTPSSESLPDIVDRQKLIVGAIKPGKFAAMYERICQGIGATNRSDGHRIRPLRAIFGNGDSTRA